MDNPEFPRYGTNPRNLPDKINLLVFTLLFTLVFSPKVKNFSFSYSTDGIHFVVVVVVLQSVQQLMVASPCTSCKTTCPYPHPQFVSRGRGGSTIGEGDEVVQKDSLYILNVHFFPVLPK